MSTFFEYSDHMALWCSRSSPFAINLYVCKLPPSEYVTLLAQRLISWGPRGRAPEVLLYCSKSYMRNPGTFDFVDLNEEMSTVEEWKVLNEAKSQFARESEIVSTLEELHFPFIGRLGSLKMFETF